MHRLRRARARRSLPRDSWSHRGSMGYGGKLRVVAHPHASDGVELGRLADEQAALRRVATLVARGADPSGLFAVVAEQVARVLHVPLVSVVRFEDDGTATERQLLRAGPGVPGREAVVAREHQRPAAAARHRPAGSDRRLLRAWRARSRRTSAGSASVRPWGPRSPWPGAPGARWSSRRWSPSRLRRTPKGASRTSRSCSPRRSRTPRRRRSWPAWPRNRRCCGAWRRWSRRVCPPGSSSPP
jgi:hypothetical protein